MKRLVKWFYNLLTPIFDPIKAIRGIVSYPRYMIEWWLYAKLPGAEPLHLANAYPQLHDRISTTGIDRHYFYVNGWAMRRIVAQQPVEHVDIGSQIMFVNLLSAILPVTFIDYRPLCERMNGLTNCSGDILNLPIADGSIKSLSCLHVAEHIGLGRYGDSLDPYGTVRACVELQRVLASGGDLYFALPVGRQRVCFNAHRIHDPKNIISIFSGFELVEFSGVLDDGLYVERANLADFSDSQYACGMFWFRKK